MDNDDEGDRPTLPSLRLKQRPKVRLRPTSTHRRRFDPQAEHFFSNVDTVPELVPDAAFIAKMAAVTAPSEEEEAARWWAEDRRKTYVRFVAALFVAALALVFAGALR